MKAEVLVKYLCPFLLYLSCAIAHAQETPAATRPGMGDRIVIPVGSQGKDHPDLVLPQKGLKQGQVREQFGEPLEQTAPKGEPPISRWRYQEFVVYFEGDTVIHSVVTVGSQQLGRPQR